MATRQPHRFNVHLDRAGDAEHAVLRAEPRPFIVGGAPPEFGGTDEVWSPEHLLVSAASLCFLTTFEFFARRAALPILGFSCEAEGTVDKTPTGLAFTGIRLAVTATVPAGETARARELLAKAKGACLVSNSLRCPVELDASVTEAPAAGATAA